MSEVMLIMQCEVIPYKVYKNVEMRGIEPRAFHMQSERSTTELHPRRYSAPFFKLYCER